MRVVGTAGHVDHGKSTLVQALTGIDPDRLKEEKSRGMTIDLGFAWFDLALSPGQAAEPIGVVDVPGHIDFIKNMLAGVGGIDAALLVIAADEGVMPQTREHLDILDLLAVPSAVVALTKIDMVDDDEWLDLVELDIGELLQTTRFADAPIVRVSPMTGQGMDDLRAALAQALAELPPRRNRERPRLPVDRVFSLSGFGTIVTGTLSDGRLEVGDDVEILPEGTAARVRGLQTHKHQVTRGEPGSRLAINLSGVSTDEVHRGEVVARSGTLHPTRMIDVTFRLLPDAVKPLRHNIAVSLFTGASETPARVRLLGKERLEPGEEGWLQLRLERPVVVAPGDRYILRQPSPSETLGGGAVLDAHPRRRWRRFDDAVLKRLRVLSAGAPDDVVLDTVAGRPYLDASEVVATSALDVDIARAALDDLLRGGAIVALPASPAPLLVSATQRDDAYGRLQEILSEYHGQYLLRSGMPKGELRTTLQERMSGRLDAKAFNALVESAQEGNVIDVSGETVRLPGFVVELSAEQQERVQRVLDALAAASVTAPSQADVLRQLGGDEELFQMLLEQGRIVRIGDGIVYRAEDFDNFAQAVRNHILTNESITLAETRDMFGTSRRYAQAILEELDGRGVTRRVGDARVLRAGR